MKKICLFAFVSMFLFLGAVQVNAATLYLVGHNYDYNTATVEFEYSYDGGFGEIDISITNTSLYDPIITGFTFNAPAEITSLESFSGPEGWTGYFNPDSIKTPEPFGVFDVAGLTGNNLAGGDPKAGIPVNETYGFNFIFNGVNLDTLTEASFLEELSYISVQNDTAVSFLARIQQVGADGELSDVMIPGPDSPNPIPEPSTMVLFGIGLLFCVGVGRRKRK